MQSKYEIVFGIEKCVKLIIISGKRQLTEEIELPNQERIRRKKGNLQILAADTIKLVEMKEKKIKREYLRKTRGILKIKQYSINLIKEINTLAFPLVIYSGPFLKWTREED